jgi:hypothetical protein
MKRPAVSGALLLLFLLGTAAVTAQTPSSYRLESVDVAVSGSLPFGAYANRHSFGSGLGVRLNTGFWRLPLELSALLQAYYLFQGAPHLDTLMSASLLVEAGWPFALGETPFTMVPRLGAGFLVHRAKGEVSSGDTEVTARYYADQIDTVKGELTFAPRKDDDSTGWAGAYVAPGFALFPNQGALGTSMSLDVGLRISFGIYHPLTTESPEATN